MEQFNISSLHLDSHGPASQSHQKADSITSVKFVIIRELLLFALPRIGMGVGMCGLVCHSGSRE